MRIGGVKGFRHQYGLLDGQLLLPLGGLSRADGLLACRTIQVPRCVHYENLEDAPQRPGEIVFGDPGTNSRQYVDILNYVPPWRLPWRGSSILSGTGGGTEDMDQMGIQEVLNIWRRKRGRRRDNKSREGQER